jgi:hypothetical protein
MKRTLILLFVLLLPFSVAAHHSTSAESNKVDWRTLWTPNQDNREVVAYFHYTYQMPVPCGEHQNAKACAHLADPRVKITVLATECIIHVERINALPTDDQLVDYGEKIIGCIRGRWLSATGTWEYNRVSVALVVEYGDTHLPAETPGGKRAVVGDPCGITIEPFKKNEKPSRDLKKSYGHETLHCIRGSWHTKPK